VDPRTVPASGVDKEVSKMLAEKAKSPQFLVDYL
jgi:hypothetical protein